ncbi:MAG: ABC transporter permease subunit [Synechococcaceae cyanobacterium RM1_1_27]|nr:ABC transporter permease subunit [Synechococcaceae cyanobacterium SM2_3_2]NJO86100.1 ABC transporter permease subunit [Synechococcaceae cyanobacterium RM1_1_27]
MTSRSSRWTQQALLWLIIGVLLLPFIPLLIWSGSQGWYFPQVWPSQWSGQGWQAILSGSARVGSGLLTSLGIAAATTGLGLLIGIPAGRALGLMDFAGKGVLRLLLLLPICVSPLATLMGIQFILIRLRLSGSVLGVILVHLIPVIPYMVLVLSSVFAHFDQGYEHQARTLGAAGWQVWRYVTLPLIAPGVVVAALFAFLISWNEFLLTFFVGGSRVLTLPMVLYASLQGGNTSLMAAIAITSLLPGLFFWLFAHQVLQDESAPLAGWGNG